MDLCIGQCSGSNDSCLPSPPPLALFADALRMYTKAIHKKRVSPVNKTITIPGCVALVALALSASQGATAAVIHVGGAGDCDANSLGEAVTLAAATSEADEIRLNIGEAPTYENTALVLIDFGTGAKGALTFAGGFSGCSDTTPSLAEAEIRGTVGEPVVTVGSSSASSVVTFRTVSLLNSGTHGLVISGNSTVTMDKARSDNHGGSGVRISSGAWLDAINATLIRNNTTSEWGGGIHCDNATVILNRSSISGNSAASGGGGGIYASNCSVEVLKGLVSSNTAIDGGGIYADQASDITITGEADGRPAINNNTATDDGGAIYAKNPGTSVFVTNGRFDGNEAVRRGGALFIDDGAELIMSANESSCRRPTAPSFASTRCSTMLSNTMSAGGLGTAIYAGPGSTSYIAHTYLEGNDGGDSLIYVTGTGTEVFLEGLSISNNAVRFLQDVGNNAFLSSAFVSGANNQYDASGTLTDADVLQLGSATAEIYSSVYQGGSFLGTSGLSGRCLMASISTPLVSDVDHFVLNPSPGFIDSASGNLRLTSDSPAVDYCDDTAYSSIWNDIDMQSRGVDLSQNPNGSPGVPGGLFDLGFDELVDAIFADRFEN